MRSAFLLLGVLCIGLWSQAQDNYEIQVYSSPTQQKGSSIFELHSNYFIHGGTETVNGVLPTNHALHETLEITTGVSDNAELGFYFFTNYTPSHGYHFVGFHIRPRVRAPEQWDLPVGLSLSMEFGYQKPDYSDETWNVEFRPIIDKQWDHFYMSFNPTLGISLKSEYNNSTPVFEPNLKMSYQFFKNGSLGLEYYGGMGYINHFDTWEEQSHAVYLVYDLVNSNNWEVNTGLGWGLTSATDKLVAKLILGRRIKWGRENHKQQL